MEHKPTTFENAMHFTFTVSLMLVRLSGAALMAAVALAVLRHT